MNKQVRNFGRAALVVALVAASSVASAAIDISTEAGAAKTEVNTAGALIIGVMVAIAVIAWIRRVIK